MVKKKQNKKVVKKLAKPRKKIVKRKISKNKPSINRKDFETFKFGVERLKELKKELDSLDTRGFSKEEQEIRIKLKNVSEIPYIEKEIKILKSKINKKYHPKKRKSIVKKDIHDIKEDIPELKKEIKKIGKKVEESAKRKKETPDSGVGILVDTDFNDFLNNIKSSLSDRVKSKEKEVEDVLKTDLQKREEKFREKYVGLIREFNEKKRKLENQLNKKYATKVKTTLQKEISEKFNYKLRKKLNAEKVELGKRYIASLREHAKTELEKQKKELRKRLERELAKEIKLMQLQKEREETEFQKQKGIEINKLEKEETEFQKQKGMEINKLEKEETGFQKLKQDFILQKQEEKKKIKAKLIDEFHGKLERELSKREIKIRQQLRNEFELNLKKKIQEHEEGIKKKKFELELEMQKKIKQVLN